MRRITLVEPALRIDCPKGWDPQLVAKLLPKVDEAVERLAQALEVQLNELAMEQGQSDQSFKVLVTP